MPRLRAPYPPDPRQQMLELIGKLWGGIEGSALPAEEDVHGSDDDQRDRSFRSLRQGALATALRGAENASHAQGDVVPGHGRGTTDSWPGGTGVDGRSMEPRCS